jgi:hypothetical protein
VIEIKAGSLYRETIAQALDYATALADLDPSALRALTTAYQMTHGGEELLDSQLGLPREVVVIVVGTDTDAGLDRLSAYLSRFGVPIRAVAFQVLAVEGECCCGRSPRRWTHITRRADLTSRTCSRSPMPQGMAAMRTIIDAARRHGLFPGPEENLHHDPAAHQPHAVPHDVLK